MHLIAPLAAGITGAGNGSVALYRRGTSTRATYYEDFEGSSSVTPTANIALDSNGRVILYVDELVDCFVYTAGGSSVCEFTAGEAASAVEVRSQSFTGTSYETAASAAGNPTTLAAILDLWKTNAGSIDWKVLVGGVATTLQAAFGSIGGLVFNVTSSDYGAAGNGTTDDTVAIQAAITACNAAGGGIVWFPEGTYRITSALSLVDKVFLVGAGAGCTTITLDHATNHLITTAGSTTQQQGIVGLYLTHSQSCSGRILNVAAATVLVVRGCAIGSGTNSAGIGLYTASSTSTAVVVEDCTFSWTVAAAATAVSCDVTLRSLQLHRCRFVMPASPAAAGGAITGRDVEAVACVFDNAAMSGGTFYGFTPGANGLHARFTDCTFTSTAGGTFTAYALGAYTSTAVFSETGSAFGTSGVTAYSYTAATTNIAAQIHLHSRTNRVKVDAHTGASYIAPVQQYGVIKMVSTEAGAVTVTIDGNLPLGARATIIIDNDDGSNRAFTPISTIFTNSGAKTINTTQGNSMDCVSVEYQEAGTALMRLQNVWAE